MHWMPSCESATKGLLFVVDSNETACKERLAVSRGCSPK